MILNVDRKGRDFMGPTSRRRSRIAKRCTIDLTTPAATEVERIQRIFELSVADVFRYSLMLMRTYADAISEGREFATIDPAHPEDYQIIKLPMFSNVSQRSEPLKANEENKQPQGEQM